MKYYIVRNDLRGGYTLLILTKDMPVGRNYFPFKDKYDLMNFVFSGHNVELLII